MKVLVVGATGYVGSAIARNFNAHGYETHGLARNAKNVAELEEAGVAPVQGDLNDLAQLKEVSKQFDIIVLAGLGNRVDEWTAVSALIESCRGSHRRFIYSSGTGVLGIESHDGRWSDYAFEEDDPFPGARAMISAGSPSISILSMIFAPVRISGGMDAT